MKKRIQLERELDEWRQKETAQTQMDKMVSYTVDSGAKALTIENYYRKLLQLNKMLLILKYNGILLFIGDEKSLVGLSEVIHYRITSNKRSPPPRINAPPKIRQF